VERARPGWVSGYASGFCYRSGSHLKAGVVGTWNSHIRIGSAQGTNLQASNCATTLSPGGNTCYGAFMSLHITSGASAYIEGLWAWVGDHDLDGSHAQVNVYGGRGILSESKGAHLISPRASCR
jgi:hypothetical protein